MERGVFNLVLIVTGFAFIVMILFAVQTVSTGYAVLGSSAANPSISNFSLGDFGILGVNSDVIAFTKVSIFPTYSYDKIEFTDYSFSNNPYYNTFSAKVISNSRGVLNISGKEYNFTYGGSGSEGWVILDNATLINKTMGENLSVGSYVLMNLSQNSQTEIPIQLREVYNKGNHSQDYVLFYSPTEGNYLPPAIPSSTSGNNATLTFYNYQVNLTYGGNGLGGWAIISKNIVPVSSLGCMDSDGGENYYVKGSIVGSGFGASDYCTKDNLTEYYCDNGYANATSYHCPDGCLNGACVGNVNYSYDPLGNANKIFQSPNSVRINASSENNSSVNETSKVSNEINNSNNETNSSNQSGVNSTLLNKTVRYAPHVKNVSFYLGSSTTLNISGTSYYFQLTNITSDKAVLTVDQLVKYSLSLGQTISVQGFNVTLVNVTLNPPGAPSSVEVSISEPYGENLSKYNVTISGPHLVNGKLVCSSGCLYNGGCLSPGSRDNGDYCRVDGNMTSELGSGSSCTNNFECSSNSCVKSQCVPSNFLQTFLSWVRSLFGGK